jgi:hypothetical protein
MLLAGRSWWWSGRWPGPPSWSGSAGAGGGGGPGLVRHGPRPLPAGRALLLARPGRPGLSGPRRRRSGQGWLQAIPEGREERSAASTAAALTAEGPRWQPVQQATGRSASGRRVPGRGAAGEAGPRRWPHRRPRPARGRTGSHGRRVGEGSRPIRSRRCWPRCPARRTTRPARATAAAIPTGAGSSAVGKGMVSSVSGRVAAGSTCSGATVGGGSTRRWRLWPAWMTHASPGWA